MIEDTTNGKNYINKINKILLTDDISDLKKLVDQKAANQYYESVRATFRSFVKNIKVSKTDTDRKALVLELCDLNRLYSIQLKLGYELPIDMYEIAYDFDNPDYPGWEYIYKKILDNGYLLQRPERAS